MLFIALVLTAVAFVGAAETSLHAAKADLYLYQQRVKFLRDELRSKCPHLLTKDQPFGRRELDDVSLELRIERQLYKHLMSLVVKCDEEMGKQSTPALKTTANSMSTLKTSTTQSSTRISSTTNKPGSMKPSTNMAAASTDATKLMSPPITSTTHEPSTTAQQSPCHSPQTRNLTESWRRYYSGRELRNSDEDLSYGAAWFRFASAAGRQLKNTCPRSFSCGSEYAVWSDDAMPTEVGKAASIHAYVSSSYAGAGSFYCKASKIKAMVMRCSTTRSDFVYRIDSYIEGRRTLCGKY